MKIAHVISVFSPHIGGMGQVCFDEAKMQTENGHRVTVFTLRYSDTVYNDQKFPFRIIRLKPFLSSTAAGFIPILTNHLKRFDIVHLHYPFYGGAEWVFIAKILFGQRYVVTFHMAVRAESLPKRIVQFVYDHTIAPFIFAHAEKIIAIDKDYFFQHVKKSFIGNNMVEVFNGIDTDIFKPEFSDLSKLDLEHWVDKKIILFVGNLLGVKRLDFLMKALMKLDDEAVLLVVGGGKKLQFYKDLAIKLGIEKRIMFTGSCSNPRRLAAYYNAASCLAVVSSAESFSLVVAEAMAVGLPVVASDVAGLRGRFPPESGFLFNPYSEESLVNSLKKCLHLSDSDRKEIALVTRKKVLEDYGLTEHARKIENIYQAVKHSFL